MSPDLIRILIIGLFAIVVLYSLWRINAQRWKYYRAPRERSLTGRPCWESINKKAAARGMAEDPHIHASIKSLHYGHPVYGQNHVYQATREDA